MAASSPESLRKIKRFDQLLAYLRDELDWPVADFEFDEVTFDWDPNELGIEKSVAAKIQSIKQLRPLTSGQEWGIFFVKFEPKQLPMVAMRRLLSKLVVKKRASSESAEHASWKPRDLLFISEYGEGEGRKISFAQFTETASGNLPTLKVLAWGETQTKLTLEDVDQKLRRHLTWPDDPTDSAAWQVRWSGAFSRRNDHVIKTSKELAKHLAELAKAIYEKAVEALKVETETGPLTKLFRAFQQALMQDLLPDNFADMYAQTITYGLFSAAVSSWSSDQNCNGRSEVTTDKMVQLVPNTNPFLRKMLSSFLSAGGEGGSLNFDELGINDVVDLLNDEKTDIRSVIREFGATGRDEDPVIHFYEDFLKVYNSKLRFDRGVFYTPKPVVSYIVRSVHELLQTELGLNDGLADTATWGDMVNRLNSRKLKMPRGVKSDDPFVLILDPATGTATFLVEVIDIIHKTLRSKWKTEGKTEEEQAKAWNDYVPQHLLPRVYGYELMMAPYAIAHMKFGLKLAETGYDFGSTERARIFLTNALEPSRDLSQMTFAHWFQALAEESRQVNHVKNSKCFSVLLGNPPYSNFGGLNRNDWIDALIADYKKDLNERKLNLDDDFIKFMRFSQTSIERTGIGLVAIITANPYLDGITHRRMRESLLESFGTIYIIDLHGNSNKIERSPNGAPDVNVFDIRQGVSIFVGLMNHVQSKKLHHSDVYGTRDYKYRHLRDTTLSGSVFESMLPTKPRFLFVPKSFNASEEYDSWISLKDVFISSFSGVQTKRDKLTISFRKEEIQSVGEDFLAGDEEMIKEKYHLREDGRDWKLRLAIKDIQRNGLKIEMIAYRVFDMRFTIYTGKTKGFLAYPRTEMSNMLKDNVGFVFKRQAKEDHTDYTYFFVVGNIISEGLFAIDPKGREYIAPLWISSDGESLLFKGDGTNFCPRFVAQVEQSVDAVYAADQVQRTLGQKRKFFNEVSLLSFIYAVCHSPSYRSTFKEALKLDYPRIPLPANFRVFETLAAIGQDLIALHLHGQHVKHKKFVMRRASKVIVDSKNITFIGRDRVVASGYPKYERDCIKINASSGFEGVAAEVWDMHVGGYRVCHKWLKDRNGMELTSDDVQDYLLIVCVLSRTVELSSEIESFLQSEGGYGAIFHGSEQQ